VDGQVTEDPEPGLQGGVADRVPAAAPGSFLLFELAAVKGGYCGGQAGRDGVEVVAAACRGAALFFVSGQGQAAAGEEPAQGPPGCAGKPGSPSSSPTWIPSSPPPPSACKTPGSSATSPATWTATVSNAPRIGQRTRALQVLPRTP
jgi:hypothetical protein